MCTIFNEINDQRVIGDAINWALLNINPFYIIAQGLDCGELLHIMQFICYV